MRAARSATDPFHGEKSFPRDVEHLDGATRKLLNELRPRLVRLFGPQLRRLVLFGSRARGDHREDSDADVALVLKDRIDKPFAIKAAVIDEVYDLFLDNGILVQPWPLEEAWLAHPDQSPVPHIVEAVLREGILV